MDGKRERPVGRSAENWSRRDGIRAGAVSGPWRSTTRRDQVAEPVAAEPEPVVAAAIEAPVQPAAAPHGHPFSPPTGPVAKPMSVEDFAAALAQVRPRPLVGPARRPAGRHSNTLRLLWPIAFGAGVAVAMIAAAFRIGPAPAEQPPMIAAVTETPAQVAMAGAVSAGSAFSGPIRVRVASDVSPSREVAILAAIIGAGYHAVTLERVPFAIARSRIGFYGATGRSAAEGLAALPGITGAAGPASVAVRDFTDLARSDLPERLDIWIGR